MPKITSDPDTLKFFQKGLRDNYNTRLRTGVHVSDLTTICLRETVFQRIKGRTIDDRTAYYFLMGEAAHLACQILFKGQTPEMLLKEEPTGHVDMVIDTTNTPVEIKTSSMFKRNIPPWYIKQICYYMVHMKKKTGHMLMIWLNPSRDAQKNSIPPGMTLHKVTITQAEYDQTEAEMKDLTDRFNTAVTKYEASGDYMALEPIPAAKFEGNLMFKCTTCTYQHECAIID